MTVLLEYYKQSGNSPLLLLIDTLWQYTLIEQSSLLILKVKRKFKRVLLDLPSTCKLTSKFSDLGRRLLGSHQFGAAEDVPSFVFIYTCTE